jgi:hypothetical protein
MDILLFRLPFFELRLLPISTPKTDHLLSVVYDVLLQQIFSQSVYRCRDRRSFLDDDVMICRRDEIRCHASLFRYNVLVFLHSESKSFHGNDAMTFRDVQIGRHDEKYFSISDVHRDNGVTETPFSPILQEEEAEARDAGLRRREAKSRRVVAAADLRNRRRVAFGRVSATEVIEVSELVLCFPDFENFSLPTFFSFFPFVRPRFLLCFRSCCCVCVSSFSFCVSSLSLISFFGFSSLPPLLKKTLRLIQVHFSSPNQQKVLSESHPKIEDADLMTF